MATYKVLMMGASYGSLLATKLLFGGNSVKLVCLPAEVEAFNTEGAIVRMPIKGRSATIELNSRKLPGHLSAAGPAEVSPSDYDLICLAMQEPQYRSSGVRELLDKVALSRVPCMSIMNMPPLPYLKRIPGLDTSKLTHCFTDATVWQNFDPGKLTLCSPDPQAIRPPGEKINVLQVTLPTNFKAARFASDKDTAILREMQAQIEAIKYDPGDGPIDLPVKLKVHDSIFVPLAKWAMLITGNYRCVTMDAAVTINEAVHTDYEASRQVYNWVRELCVKLGGVARRPGAVREIRCGGQGPGAAVLGGAGPVRRRAKHRTGGSAGAGHRGAARHEERRARRDGRDGRRAAGAQPESRRLIDSMAW